MHSVDPNGIEAEWSTLKALADFKRSKTYKVEIFLLFAPPMFMRVLPVNHGEVTPENAAKIDAIFGSDDWKYIYNLRRKNLLKPKETRNAYLNLMRWRLENKLGYKWTHPIEINNTDGNPIYFMIFATDHKAGTKIISHLYAKAAAEFPAMREQARRMREKSRQNKKGVLNLFTVDPSLESPIKKSEPLYEHQPPIHPHFIYNKS